MQELFPIERIKKIKKSFFRVFNIPLFLINFVVTEQLEKYLPFIVLLVVIIVLAMLIRRCYGKKGISNQPAVYIPPYSYGE